MSEEYALFVKVPVEGIFHGIVWLVIFTFFTWLVIKFIEVQFKNGVEDEG